MNNGYNSHYSNYPRQHGPYPGMNPSYYRPNHNNFDYNYAREMEWAMKESLKDAPPQNFRGTQRQSSVDEVQLQKAIQESLLMNPYPHTNRYNEDSNTDRMLEKAIQESLNDQKPPYKNQEISKSRSFEKQQQDDEFKLAEQKAIREKIEKDRNKTMEEELKEACKQSTETNKYEKINRFLEKSKFLPDEPQEGILIAIVLPTNKRVTRKFLRTELADDVYTWIAVEQYINKNEDLPDFKLSTYNNQVLNAENSLESQGIGNRVLLRVVTD